MDIQCKLLERDSPSYPQVMALRQELLRKPLGLDLFLEDLDAEADQLTLVALRENEVIACLLLQPYGEHTLKLRQMAVSAAEQGKGTGSKLVKFAENFCRLNGFTEIILHARASVLPFYEQLGYHVVGDEFTEVGIPHYKMQKDLGTASN